MQEKSPGSASRICLMRGAAAEKNNNNNNENSDSSQFYEYIPIVRIESLRSEGESSAGKKQIFNVSI